MRILLVEHGATRVAVLPDRAKLSRLGLSVSDHDNAMQTSLGGATAGAFYEG